METAKKKKKKKKKAGETNTETKIINTYMGGATHLKLRHLNYKSSR